MHVMKGAQVNRITKHDLVVEGTFFVTFSKGGLHRETPLEGKGAE